MSTWVNFLEILYPVGSVYLSSVDTSPASKIGGDWEQIKGACLTAAGANDITAGVYNGSLKITTDQLPSHTHPMNLYKSQKGVNDGVWNVFWDSRSGDTPAQYAVNTSARGGGRDFLPYSYGVYTWRRIA